MILNPNLCCNSRDFLNLFSPSSTCQKVVIKRRHYFSSSRGNCRRKSKVITRRKLFSFFPPAFNRGLISRWKFRELTGEKRARTPTRSSSKVPSLASKLAAEMYVQLHTGKLHSHILIREFTVGASLRIRTAETRVKATPNVVFLKNHRARSLFFMPSPSTIRLNFRLMTGCSFDKKRIMPAAGHRKFFFSFLPRFN